MKDLVRTISTAFAPKTLFVLKIASVDKGYQQLKFEVWDVNKPTETYSKVMGLNLDPSNLFID